MTIQSLYPSIKPTLNLDFANSKALDPRITFTRASTATYYDGKSVAKAEENLVTYSQDLSNAAWVTLVCTKTSNALVAPDGTSTGTTITAGTVSSSYSNISRTSFLSTGSTYTVSFYAKQGTYQYIGLGTNQTTNVVTVDLSTGTIVTGSGVVTSAGNGWYRISAQLTPGGAQGFFVEFVTSGGNPVVTTVGTETFHVWGFQAEQRSFLTAYTPTTTSAITNYIPALQTAPANIARFDHDPITGESKGLLIEESRTNLLTYSSDFGNAAWPKSNATVQTDAVVAPDGTLTADKLVANTSTGYHALVNSTATVASQTYTLSIYAKAGEYGYLNISPAGPYSYQLFNLINGTVGALASGFVSASITPAGNGWYRCFATYVATGTANSPGFYMGNTSSSTPSYTGDGYSGIYIWGAQLEAGAFPTSYIPTTSAQVTRAADAASMTGTNFSSWYRASEWTLMAEASCANPSGVSGSAGGLFNIPGGGTDRISAFVGASGSARYESVVSGGVPFGLNTIAASAGVFYKNVFAYQVDNFAMSTNGGAPSIDLSGVVMSGAIEFQLGKVFNAGQLNGHIRRIAYYPKRLTNAQLQALTA